MRHTITRALSSTCASAILLVVANAAAYAHEEGGAADPQLAESVAPGIMGIGILIAAALGVGLWVHFRRAAMLRSIRQEIDSASRSGSDSTRAQDGR